MMNTLLIIIEQTLLHLPLMIGAYVSFSLLKIPDLSIESAYVVGALTGSFVLTMFVHLPLSVMIIILLCASVIGGSLVGLTSSMLTQKANFPHLLSSIITSGFFHGINQFISAPYVSLSKQDNPLRVFAFITQYPELPILFIIGCVVIIGIIFLFKTQIGYSYAVYGNNPQFFKNYGISTWFVFITGVMLANGLAGMSGYLFAQSNNFFELNMGLGKALLCITSLILDKGIIRTKKSFTIFLPLAGTMAYFSLQQLLLKFGFNLQYFTAVQALVVFGILFFTYRKKLPNDNLGV